MNNGLIRVAVVTPVHNRRDITLQCLRSLSRVNQQGLEVITFVVDDGSTDGTSEAIAAEFPDVTVIPGDGELLFTEGTNVGVRAALEHDPDYVLMMNDDQVFDPEFLQRLVETAEKYPRSVVGPLLLLWDTPHKLFQTSPRWETLSGGWRHWQRQTVWTIPKSPWEVDLIVGNCLLVPVAAFREEGLMNSARYPFFGDAEFTPRLQKRGWRLLIDPRSRVFCQPNNLPARLSKMTLREKWNALVVDLRHTHNLRRRFYACWDGAPTHLQGAVAFGVFIARVALRINTEVEQGAAYSEPPLSETFASRVIR
jgi:GT2 family glycosyltransferase